MNGLRMPEMDRIHRSGERRHAGSGSGNTKRRGRSVARRGGQARGSRTGAYLAHVRPCLTSPYSPLILSRDLRELALVELRIQLTNTLEYGRMRRKKTVQPFSEKHMR